MVADVASAFTAGSWHHTPLDFPGAWTLIPLSNDPYDAGFAPLGRRVVIDQNTKSIAFITTANFTDLQSARAYKLDGPSKKTIDTGPNETREETSTTAWKEDTLVITTEWPLHRRVQTLRLDSHGQLIATAETSLLTDRGGRLVVSTIGPNERSYKRAEK